MHFLCLASDWLPQDTIPTSTGFGQRSRAVMFVMNLVQWLQKTQLTRGGAITVVWQILCKLCLPSCPQQWGPDYRFLCKPVMRTRWMAGTAPHKSGRCRYESRSDKYTQTSLDLRYLSRTNTGIGSRYR